MLQVCALIISGCNGEILLNRSTESNDIAKITNWHRFLGSWGSSIINGSVEIFIVAGKMWHDDVDARVL